VIDGYLESLRSVQDLPQMIRDAPVLRCCFLNPRVVCPAIQAEADAKMVQSTNQLADLLLTSREVMPFYPRQAILKQEAIDAEERRQRAIAEAEQIRQQQLEQLQRQTHVKNNGGGCMIC
jgi:hypothetical protein